eukprot:IDg3582t1
MTEEQEEKVLEDEPVNSFGIIVENLPDVDEFPSQIISEELIESQMYDNFSNEIRSAINRREAVSFRDKFDTGVLDRISSDGCSSVIPDVL